MNILILICIVKNYKERYKQEESELKMKVLAIDYDGVIVDMC